MQDKPIERVCVDRNQCARDAREGSRKLGTDAKTRCKIHAETPRQRSRSAAIRRTIASVLRFDIDPPTDLPA
ncbi:hypothetical protein [Burkholderia cepacia]|uniref:Uncharacterized protein n=1 Tax=Burkholderia cepacia TaxID=292 RepID=A0A8I1DL95_BURCE|nr:hypothetical protein [Burkholderia cepacia]MBH9698859.1 hypothetical protein [Burkholderia cepacia]MBX3980131.1 hypothetical protein [Burkholderia cepacia]MBX4011935.1 hypothetical protein [Burkholderia cepacia]MBX4051645.1 hypothetical protein [Burkholderia cepacia]MBX4067603.1 hypothetical protein [Burkholderia cepacia]